MHHPFSFTLQTAKGHARAGEFFTPHGKVKTPVFMPVGTLATIKSLDTQDIAQLNVQIILANTYHLYLTPGMEVIQAAGGLHSFMRWDKPMLTDSGGFQVFSLGLGKQQKPPDQLIQNPNREHQPDQAGGQTHWNSLLDKHTPHAQISDQGVHFTSHRDGSKHFFSPEKSIEIQRMIGADIIMAFDECTPDQADAVYTNQALERTHQWAKQCKVYWESQNKLSVYGKYQALFGIVQGAMHPELRQESARVISQLGFDGIALGGETVGYNMAGTVELMNWVRAILPEDKPRYAMGLGRDPQNLVDAVLAGYDMFDCVAPTRFARNGALYNGELVEHGGSIRFESEFPQGRLQIGNQRFTLDQLNIQPGCDCFTCVQGYSRSYLRHLYKTDELTYFRLSSIHNVRFMVRLSEQLRSWVLR